jgi:hypothetical protein
MRGGSCPVPTCGKACRSVIRSRTVTARAGLYCEVVRDGGAGPGSPSWPKRLPGQRGDGAYRRERSAVDSRPAPKIAAASEPLPPPANCSLNPMASWQRMVGHLLSKGPLHGICRNSRVSSFRRCRELRRRHPWGLRPCTIDCLGSLNLGFDPI